MEPILKVGLLDDENHPRILLTEIIGSIPGFEISFSLDDPFRALELLQNRAADILITDIKMPGFSGLELSRKINHLEIPIIICSGHTEFGVESFKVNAIHFILKPPGMIEVSEALDKARSIISKTKSPEKEYHQDFILVRELGEFKHVFIKPLDIKYIEQKGELTWIYLDSGEFIRTRNRLYATIEKVNRPYIFKIHRSFAVNYMKIKSLDQGYCHFEENIKVPIGREYRQEFVEFLKSKTLT
ncbi:LytR/AlgR family response regulator transcription factor [Algoriphagus algorifonticola]|jgi:DNA-binding LytR/AlgR family response regulator|uniref:LytR/AlgR family response regulator transcription factor n=1 Tax=Algoriphagus algorifonticola TaxID=2593007 RepID=UPI00119E4629|nr:LytTR family DNA-binding domain-containing protein [Algoriphagus algorifonticola]